MQTSAQQRLPAPAADAADRFPTCQCLRRPHPFTVVYDPDAVIELATAVKSKEERKAIFNAVDKLRELGERLAPPHMKPLQGAAGLCELRPRQGRSDWRPVYVRRRDVFVVVAIDRHDNFEALLARAQRRAAQYRLDP